MITPDQYFDLLAHAFPVMCASDEFHFLPRAQQAIHRLDRLDDLDPDALDGLCSALKDMRSTFLHQAERADDLETTIDHQTLALNADGVLLELETNMPHRHNPLLYLKIAGIGLDHAWNKPAAGLDERMDRTLSRLQQIPRLLAQARSNLTSTPENTRLAAQAMVRDCSEYLDALAAKLPDSRTIERMLADCRSAFERFAACVAKLKRDIVTPRVPLADTLARTFGSERSPEEIFELAEEEWHGTLSALERQANAIDPGRSWLEIYESFTPPIEATGLEEAYREVIGRLRDHFAVVWPSCGHTQSPMSFASTPLYLRSVRSSASFAAAFSDHPEEISYFYITPGGLTGRSREAGARLDKRFLREIYYLCAHETWPGHHLLDSTRRFLDNPVRRQVENPLFYEGWAYFAESTLSLTGFLGDPHLELVYLRRSLWRSARCMIDTGLAIHRLDRAQCISLLQTIGFSLEEARVQVDRYRLNPGYQLCYALGRIEIQHLRDRFSPRLDLESFCRLLLTGGEVPFHLAGERIEHIIAAGETL